LHSEKTEPRVLGTTRWKAQLSHNPAVGCGRDAVGAVTEDIEAA
jgi:hypothetical protein